MQTAQIATTHIGCRGRYIRLGDQEMFDYCFPFLEVWEEKKRPLLISALHFLVITDGDTARELAILTPFIKPVGRTHGFQAGSVHVSLLRLWLFCSFDIAE